MSKTYAVTGVASGIGAALARILKTNGDRVIGFDITEMCSNLGMIVGED